MKNYRITYEDENGEVKRTIAIRSLPEVQKHLESLREKGLKVLKVENVNVARHEREMSYSKRSKK